MKDAEKCVKANVGGILLSHHHSILHSAIPALMLLPELRREFRKELPIFADGGFETGVDVFKALAIFLAKPPIQRQSRALWVKGSQVGNH